MGSINSKPDTDPRRTRRSKETKPADYREPAQKDYDRIVYSSAFRRLAGVTQVVAAGEGHVFHNRLTHSLKVGQLARRLAQKVLKEDLSTATAVGGIDPDVTEAAGLAHDLGHPPFGHIAEEELREQVSKYKIKDAFEGNAQSFRIVTRLALRDPKVPGLNLSRATLNAILKYPWMKQSDKQSEKYGSYESEVEDLQFARELLPDKGDIRKGPEAELMDWADDVTYAVHDAEDFYRARLIPMDRLSSLKDDSERRRFFDGLYGDPELRDKLPSTARSELEQDFVDAVTIFSIPEPYSATREHRSRLRDFSSTLIGQFVNALKLQHPSTKTERFVAIRSKQEHQVKILKMLTWYYVIYNPALATQQFGQRRIIRELFEDFFAAATDSRDLRKNIFPVAYREHIQEASGEAKRVARVVADLIASMSEQEVLGIFQRLKGIHLGSVLDYLKN